MAARSQTNNNQLLICTCVFLPLRLTPSHRSEMISQILFGERFRVMESSGSWLKIEIEFDSYQGWIDSGHGGYTDFADEGEGIIASREMTCLKEDGSTMSLVPGSELFNLSKDFSSFSMADMTYQIPGSSKEWLMPDASVTGTALRFLNAPYLWGGRTPGGIDCSGLVQIIFKIHGITLPRDASKQSEHGKMVEFIEQAAKGDLLFFSGDSEKISHTGILLTPGKVIHASGCVKISTVDHQGIWDNGSEKYTHRLRFIKRINQ